MDCFYPNTTPREPFALRFGFRERLTVSAAAVVGERVGDASALERMPTA